MAMFDLGQMDSFFKDHQTFIHLALAG